MNNQVTNKEDIRRYPRPMGTTFKSLQLQQQKNKAKKKQLKRNLKLHILKDYMLNSMRLNNKQASIAELAVYLNTDSDTIMKYIATTTNELSHLVQKDKIEETVRVLFSIAINNSLVDRGRALSQAELLTRSQGARYKPFVSGEVNRSIKNLLDSQRPLIEILKSLSGQGGPSFTINNLNQQETNQNYLTVDSAMKVINEGQSNPKQLSESTEALFIEHKLEGTPEVNANYQDVKEDIKQRKKDRDAQGPVQAK